MKPEIPEYIIDCISCGNSRFRNNFLVDREDKFAINGRRKEKPAHYFECSDCGLFTLDDISDYQNIYSDGGYYESEDKNDTLNYIKNRFDFVVNLDHGKSDNKERIKRFLNFIDSHAASKLNILDIGAGMGVFFYELYGKIKFKGVALELDPYCTLHLKKIFKNYPFRVTNELIENFVCDNTFEFITINRVLEHVFNPVNFLKKLKKFITKSSTIYVEVPDSESYYLGGSNDEAFGYGHYHVYSPEALIKVFNLSGYKVSELKRCIEPSNKYTLYGFFKLK
tara:strand:+ start:27081 stop:27923 length:843 start_codon:yes stop_codon:yes gene_type:complete